MKRKNKGKVYPSPSSSSSSSSTITSPALPVSSSDGGDVLSVLTLLPAAILALVSILSSQDREVLAYMITRSMKTPSFQLLPDSKKKPTKKLPPNKTQHHGSSNHKVPIFDCDCFDCYRSYWFRWDSSPNRELIHQAIESFEDHLSNGEQSPSPTTTRKSARGKRKDKTGRRVGERLDFDVVGRLEMLSLESPPAASPPPEASESFHPSSPALALSLAAVSPYDDVASPAATPGTTADGGREEGGGMMTMKAVEKEDETAVVVSRTTHLAVSNHHKGLARKVLPDVLGLLNSRLWSLWSPNV